MARLSFLLQLVLVVSAAVLGAAFTTPPAFKPACEFPKTWLSWLMWRETHRETEMPFMLHMP